MLIVSAVLVGVLLARNAPGRLVWEISAGLAAAWLAWTGLKLAFAKQMRKVNGAAR